MPCVCAKPPDAGTPTPIASRTDWACVAGNTDCQTTTKPISHGTRSAAMATNQIAGQIIPRKAAPQTRLGDPKSLASSAAVASSRKMPRGTTGPTSPGRPGQAHRAPHHPVPAHPGPTSSSAPSSDAATTSKTSEQTSSTERSSTPEHSSDPRWHPLLPRHPGSPRRRTRRRRSRLTSPEPQRPLRHRELVAPPPVDTHFYRSTGGHPHGGTRTLDSTAGTANPCDARADADPGSRAAGTGG